MATSLETAIIEIVADTQKFEKSLETNLRKAFKELERIGDRALGNLDRSFSTLTRSVQSGFGQALLRASKNGAAGLEDIEDGLEEIANTMRARVRPAINDVGQSIRKLGQLPELEHMQDDIKAVASEFQKGLRTQVEATRKEMIALGKSGKSLEEIREAIAQLARRDLQLLEAGIEDVRVQLRALGASDDTIDKLTRSILQMNGALDKTASSARQASAATRSFNAHTANSIARGEGLRNGLQRTRLALTDLRFLAIAAGGAIGVNLAGNAIKAAGEFQTLEAGIRTYVAGVEGAQGATEKTAIEINKIREVALDTPFDFKELADATRRMAAFSDSTGRAGGNISETFGTAREDVKDLSGLLSVLGQGSDALKPLIKAIGDVGARGRITGEEVRQFTNALPGFNTIGAIAEGLNTMGFEFDKNAVQAGDFAAAGATAKQVLDALFIGVRAFPGAQEALEAQTLTLAGQFERFGEAMQIAASDGFRPLADALVPATIDELGVLEQVVQDLTPAVNELGKGLSGIIGDNILGLSESFGDLGRDFGQLLQGDAASQAVKVLAEGFGELLELGIPLAELFFELINATQPFFEIATVGTKVILELVTTLAQVPGLLEALATAFVAVKIAKFVQGMSILLTLGGGVGPLFASMGKDILKSVTPLGQVLKAVGPMGGAFAAAGIAIAGFIEHNKQIDEVARETAETLDELTKAGEALGKDGFTAASEAIANFRTESGKTAQQVRDDFSNVEQEIGGRFSAAVGRLVPFLETGAEAATIQFEGMQRGLEEFEQQTLTSAQSLSGLRQVFTEFGGTGLSGDDIRMLAQTLGVDLSQGADIAGAELRGLIADAGGLPALLRNSGFSADQVNSSLGSTASTADRVRSSISAMTDALQSHIDLQRAQIDPAFAALQAQNGLIEAQQGLKDTLADSEASLQDRQQAAIGLAEAELTLRDASVALANSEGGLVGAATAINDLLSDVEGGPAAAEILGTAFDDLAPRVTGRLEEIASEADTAIGIELPASVLVGTEGVVAAFEAMETETTNVFVRLQGQALTDMASVGTNAVTGLAGKLEDGASLSRVARAAAALARRIKTEMEEELETASPSKATARIGGYAAQGLVVGMDRLSGAVAKSAGGLASNVLGPLSRVSSPAMASGSASGSLALKSASGGSSVTNNKKTIIESPVSVSGAGDPIAIGKTVASTIARKAGL